MILSSMAERTAMAEEDRRLLREGVPPEVAGPRAYRDLRYCGCQQRPEPGSEWDKRLACEAAYQAQHYDRRYSKPWRWCICIAMRFPAPLRSWAPWLGDRSTEVPGYSLDETGADVDWDLLLEGWLSTTEKAVVHIAHGCAILERHGSGLPAELRRQGRAAVASITE